MSELTNEQIARLFELCAEIVAVRDTMPAAPQGVRGAELELAKNTRSTLAQHNAALVELADLLI